MSTTSHGTPQVAQRRWSLQRVVPARRMRCTRGATSPSWNGSGRFNVAADLILPPRRRVARLGGSVPE
jgi:hypothetical protein